MNYSLGCVNCFVSIHVLLQLSVFYHHHEENEASYADWLSCSKYVEFTLDLHLIIHFVHKNGLFKNQRVLKQRISNMDTAHPRGRGLATQSTPLWISFCCILTEISFWPLFVRIATSSGIQLHLNSSQNPL